MPTTTPTSTPVTSTSPRASSPIRAVAIHAASALPSGDAGRSAKVVQRLLWGGVRVAVLVEGGEEEEEAGERLLSSLSGSSPSFPSSSAAASLVQAKLCPSRARQCWKRALSDAVSSLGLPHESVALAVGARGSKGDDDGDDDEGCRHRRCSCCTCGLPSSETAREEEESPRDPAEAAARELRCPVIFVEQRKEDNNDSSERKSKSKSSSTSTSLTAIERAVARSHASSSSSSSTPAALLVGVCMRASREEDLLSRGMLPRVPLPEMEGKGAGTGGGGGGGGARNAAVVFERVLASELKERCSQAPPLDAILHKVTDELGEEEEEDDDKDGDGGDDDEEIRRNHPSWPRAARSLAALSSATSSSSSSPAPSTSGKLVIVDDVASVMRLSDRFETAEALLEALGTAAASPAPSSSPSSSSPSSSSPPPTSLVAGPPPSLCVSAGEAKALFDPATTTTATALLSEKGLSFPVIVKPRAACGVPEAHRLAVALDERGLEAALRAVGALGGASESESEREGKEVSSSSSPSRNRRRSRLPAGALIQRYVDHGGVVFKVYAAAAVGGDDGEGSGGQKAKVFVERRASTPDLGSGEGGSDDGPGWLSFDSAAPLSDAVPSWPQSRGSTAASARAEAEAEAEARCSSLDPRVASATADALLSGLGLSLLGFDAIVERGTGRCFVVDVNYFPSMKGGGTPRGVLAGAVAAQVARARNKEKKRGEEEEEEGKNE